MPKSSKKKKTVRKPSKKQIMKNNEDIGGGLIKLIRGFFNKRSSNAVIPVKSDDVKQEELNKHLNQTQNNPDEIKDVMPFGSNSSNNSKKRKLPRSNAFDLDANMDDNHSNHESSETLVENFNGSEDTDTGNSKGSKHKTLSDIKDKDNTPSSSLPSSSLPSLSSSSLSSSSLSSSSLSYQGKTVKPNYSNLKGLIEGLKEKQQKIELIRQIKEKYAIYNLKILSPVLSTLTVDTLNALAYGINPNIETQDSIYMVLDFIDNKHNTHNYHIDSINDSKYFSDFEKRSVKKFLLKLQQLYDYIARKYYFYGVNIDINKLNEFNLVELYNITKGIMDEKIRRRFLTLCKINSERIHELDMNYLSKDEKSFLEEILKMDINKNATKRGGYSSIKKKIRNNKGIKKLRKY